MKNETVFRFMAEPGDVNFGGKVHGGIVMKWIDQTAYTCALNWCSKYCVTVYVGGIRFMKPIYIGDVVEITAKIIYTGKTSMHISIDINAENPRTKKIFKTTHCIIVFVAVDEDGNPTPVPAWIPKDEKEKYMEDYAKRLIKQREKIDDVMKEFL